MRGQSTCSPYLARQMLHLSSHTRHGLSLIFRCFIPLFLLLVMRSAAAHAMQHTLRYANNHHVGTAQHSTHGTVAVQIYYMPVYFNSHTTVFAPGQSLRFVCLLVDRRNMCAVWMGGVRAILVGRKSGGGGAFGLCRRIKVWLVASIARDQHFDHHSDQL